MSEAYDVMMLPYFVGFGVVITCRRGIFLYWQELSVLAQRKTSIYRLTRVAAMLIRTHLLVSLLFSRNRALPTRILKPDDPHDLLYLKPD